MGADIKQGKTSIMGYTLDELLQLLDRTPVISSIHPVSLCFFPDNVMVYDSLAQLAWELDAPQPTLPQRILVTAGDPYYQHRFPTVRCEHDPFTPALNQVLYDHYEYIEAHMLSQQGIGERILNEAGDAQVVVLMLIDGLSYRDVVNWQREGEFEVKIEPCLVNGPTVTRIGFRNIVGDPPLAARLFDHKFVHRLGFTYWYREDNTLTNYLFRTIGQIEKVGHFAEILQTLRAYFGQSRRDKTYIQVLLSGLDGYAHRQKRKPPVEAIVAEIQHELFSLTRLFLELGLGARIYLTSDHGILWRDEFEPKIIGNAPGKSNPRCCGWSELYHQAEPGKRFNLHGEELFCLNYPKLRRELHIDDQGVHGGISFQESIVPFVSVEVNLEA